MIQKISFMLLIVLTALGLEAGQITDAEAKVTKKIANKKIELKKYRRDLKSLLANNMPEEDIKKQKKKIKNTEQEIKDLKKQERTSNTFFKRKSDIEARTTFDVNHGQDIYAPNYFQASEPLYDLHDQLTQGYFPNH